MARIHSTARVEPGAVIGRNVRIGPFCQVGAFNELGDGCELTSHVALAGHTRIGARTLISAFASVGAAAQDLRDRGEPTRTSIGEECVIAERVTINRGTAAGVGHTQIGDRCHFHISSHVAHDCLVGSDVTLLPHAMMAGHCTIGDHATLGPGAGIHQFVRIGRCARVDSLSAVLADVIPFGHVGGPRANLRGLNVEGLAASGLSEHETFALRRTYRLLFADEGTFAERLEDTSIEFASVYPAMEIVAFIRASEKRGLCLP